MMKRWISWMLALSLILCAAAVPAMAEGNTTETDTVTSASVHQKNGRDNNTPDGQTQNNSRTPGRQMPNGQMPNGQMPNGQGRGGRHMQPGSAQAQPAGAPDSVTPMETPNGTTGEAAAPAEMPNGTSGEAAVPQEMPGGINGEAAAPQETPENSQPAENADSAQAAGKTKRDKTRTGGKGKTTRATAVQGITFELLLEKGVISREVYDAIMKFIKEYTAENAQAAPAVTETQAADGVSDT